MGRIAKAKVSRTGLGSRRLALTISAVLGLMLLVAPAVFAQDEVVSAVSTASLSHDPGYVGYWKYCVDISWNVIGVGDTPYGVSHSTVILGLDNCPDACDRGYLLFPDTVGVSSGEGDCYVDYYDLSVIANNWLRLDCTVPGNCQGADFEPVDGQVDLFDFSYLAEQWMSCNDPQNANCTPNW